MNDTMLKRDMEIEAGGLKVRESYHKRKFVIRGDHDGQEDVVFWSKPGTHNGVELSWSGHIERVDMRIKHKPYWVWNYCTLRKKDLLELARWLREEARKL